MPSLMHRSFAFTILTGLALASPALADIDGHGPDAYQVVGVAADDVLNARMGPGTDYGIISHFQPDEHGLQQITCVPFLPAGAYFDMTPAERKALPETWCLMRSADLTRAGWTAARFLQEDSEPVDPRESGTEPGIASADDAQPETVNTGDGGQMMTVRAPEAGLTYTLPPGWGADEPYFYETAAGSRATHPTVTFYVNDKGQWRPILWLNLRQFRGAGCVEIEAGSLCYEDKADQSSAEYLAPMIKFDPGM